MTSRASLIYSLRTATPILRTIAAAVLVTFSWLVLQPAALAAKNASSPFKQSTSHVQSSESQLSKALLQVKVTLEAARDKLEANRDISIERKRLDKLREQIDALDESTLERYAEIGAYIKNQKLQEVIMQRHEDAVHAYRKNMVALQDNLHAIKTAKDAGALKVAVLKAIAHIAEKQQKPSHRSFDPSAMPFRASKNNARKPIQTDEALRSFFKGSDPVGFGSKDPVNNFPVGKVMTADVPVPADLLSTEDVQITPEIQALASTLNNDPVEVYNWVHNNIEFVPTYGSIQGSQMTLESRRGNAFDTASLLIALLRASNIPAKYVYGTVEIPIEQVMNWVGPVKAPEVAQDLLAQGGIPTVAIVHGGQIEAIEIEHVWVDAWVDFEPSRGANYVEGDSWVSLDASFKRYAEVVGSGLLSDVPFDLVGLNQQLMQTAVVNDQLSSVANIDQSIINAAIKDYRQQVDAYIASNVQNPTVDNVLGGRQIIQEQRKSFAAGLPYRVVAKANSSASLPSQFRHYAIIKAYASSFDQVLDSPFISQSISMPSISSKRLGVTYEPATEADAQALESFRSSGASSLPIYLISMRPVLMLDEERLAVGASSAMGIEQFFRVDLMRPNGREVASFKTFVGDEVVFGINGNGINQNVVQSRLDKVPADTAAENLHQVALHYWMESDYLDEVTARGVGLRVVRLSSVGAFYSPLTVNYFFGVPRSGVYQSRVMDVQVALVGLAGGDAEARRNFMKQVGNHGSFLEGGVFDQLFGKLPGSGISATQLISDSNFQGITIYHITEQNMDLVLPVLLVDSDVKSDIRAAVAAGKEVLVPERSLTRGEWGGTGYIIRDLETGAGAYLISGGLNGGGDVECEPSVWPLVIAIVLVVLVALLFIYLLPEMALAAGAAGAEVFAAVRAMVAGAMAMFATSPAYAASEADFEACEQQWEDDTAWCDNNTTGVDNVACHRRAQDNFYRCLNGCSRLPWMP